MDQTTMQVVFGQPPTKAIEYLEQKQVMPSQDWWQVQGNAHNKSFVVAHMTNLDLLEDVRKSLVDAQKNGWDLKRWSQEIEPKMKQRGWWGKQDIMTEDGQRTVQLGNPYRLKTIYQTNMAQAYEAGRQDKMWEDDRIFPYVMYSAILDNKTRPQHRSLHGVVMKKSDPAWAAIAPKNGYNCRCTVIELMDYEVQGQGLKVYDSTGYLHIDNVDTKHGGIAQVARLDFPDRASFRTDAGWVGRPNSNVTEQLLTKAAQSDPVISSSVVKEVFKNKEIVKQYNDEVKQWIQSVDTQKPRGEMRPVGTLDKQFLEVLKKKKGIELESSVITVHDRETLRHIDQSRKTHNREWVENIVENLNGKHDLYWDKPHATPLLVFDLHNEGVFYKVVLQINQKLKGRDAEGVKQNIVGNVIRTLIVEEPDNLLKSPDYEYLATKK